MSSRGLQSNKNNDDDLYDEDDDDDPYFREDESIRAKESDVISKTIVESQSVESEAPFESEEDSSYQEDVAREVTEETANEEIENLRLLTRRRSSKDKTANPSPQCCAVESDEEDTEEVNSSVMKNFVTQLRQVNGIITDMMDELSKNSRNLRKNKCCRICKFRGNKDANEKGNNEDKHQHGNIDKLKKSRGICCIKMKNPNRRVSENCIVCQLITLQERVDVLLEKEYDDDDECVKELKDEQSRLKDYVKKLVKTCDKSMVKGKIPEMTNEDSKASNESTDLGKSSTDDLNKGCKIFRYKSDVNKTSKLQESVFLHCINELVILIKSMNCMASPGTFWQKPIANDSKKLCEKCCRRDYPHMHGELNGVRVILKLHPSKNRKCVEEEPLTEEEEQVPEEEVVVHNEQVETEESNLQVKPTVSEADSLSSGSGSDETISDDIDQLSTSDIEFATDIKDEEDRNKYNKGSQLKSPETSNRRFGEVKTLNTSSKEVTRKSDGSADSGFRRKSIGYSRDSFSRKKSSSMDGSSKTSKRSSQDMKKSDTPR